MAAPIRIIAALNGELARVAKGTNNETLETKNKYITDILTVLAVHQSGDKTIMANEGLSQQGKLEQLKKLGTTQTAPALKSLLRDKIKDLQAKEQHYRTQFLTIDSGIKDLVERLPIFIYLWNKLDVLDSNARIKRFCLAAEADEVKVLAAMLDHPEGPMVDQEVRERALLQRAERRTPQDVENYEQTGILLEFLVMMRDWIARWLVEEVGVGNAVIRTNFGDEIADALAGRLLETEPQLAGASK